MNSVQFEMQRLLKQTKKVEEEGSVTGGGEAYLPGLDVPEKKYKVGYMKDVKETSDKEPKLAAGKAKVYMKNKWGWKDAPSVPNRPSNAIVYKQLFEDDVEPLEIDDRVKVVYGNEFYGETGTIADIHRGFVTVEMDRDGREYSMHSSDVQKIEDDEDDYDDEDLYEREVQQAFDFKIGDEVVVPTKRTEFHGVVSGFTDDKVLVDITSGGGSTFKRPNMPFSPSVLKKKEGDEAKAKPEETPEEELNEGFKRDIKVRNESQQLKEATKMIKKKLKEINSILEYAKQLKSGLQENECESCSRMMESMKKSIAEAYKKMKEL